MECDMKKLPDKAAIVEIITWTLCPLRQHRSNAQACAAIERAIEMIEQHREATRPKPATGAELEFRNWWSRSGPHAASIRQAATKLRKALEPFSGGLPVELKDPPRVFRTGSEQYEMPLRVFRSALEWLGSKDGPPLSIKHCAAEFAYGLVNEFSQKPPTGTADGPVRQIGNLLYQAVAGEKAPLKRQTDAVLKRAREHPCIIVRGGFEGNEPLQATIDGHTIFREPGEDELGFMHRAIEAARASRALPVIISEGPL
jgi:hypothetical protein